MLCLITGHLDIWTATSVSKTGTTAKLCGDMGILAPKGQNGRRYPYVVVGIIEKQRTASNYGRWKMARGKVIRHVSSMIYQTMKANRITAQAFVGKIKGA